MSLTESRPKFNPRLLPPLIGLGLLLVIALAVLFSRGSRNKTGDEPIAARLVRTVEQTSDFTYLEVTDEEGTLWVATPRVEVEVGDRVHFDSAEEYRDFKAPSLKRSFDRLLLVGQLYKVDADGESVALEPARSAHGRDLMDAAHAGIPGHGSLAGHGGIPGHGAGERAGDAAKTKVPKLEKAEGGQTLAEIATSPDKFAGQSVNVRGIVVSARQRVRPAPGEKATNWYRLQDGSGADPLMVTCDETLAVGDVVTISGKLGTDKDFGGGFKYKMIVQDARITREKAAEAKSEPPSTKSKTSPKDKGPKP
jgi:hypothetical protein